jgi:transposase
MALSTDTLPKDIQALQRLILEYDSKIRVLEEENQFLKQKIFGRNSEKRTEAERRQLYLFNEAEAVSAEAAEETEPDEIVVPAHTRTKPRGRKPLPAHLPRVEVVHDVTEEEKRCGCGTLKSRIGEESSERLDIVPAQIRVIRDIRPKYACRVCEGVADDGPTVVIAPVAPYLIPKGIATAGLLAHVLTAKFVDALPFYRQAKQFERLGVELSRTTMCGWAMQVAERSQPVMEQLREQIRAGPLLRCDETTLQVLAEPGRAAETKSYMWLFYGGPPGQPAIEYQYHPSRAGRVAAEYLAGYQGYVQTDGYVGYDFLDAQPGVVHLGCWAHVRRKFYDVSRAVSGGAKSGRKKSGSADVALGFIGQLYAIERSAVARALTPEQLRCERQEKAQPILDDFKQWLDGKGRQTPPTSLLGKAVSYALGQWKRLTVYVEDGLLTPDNNLAENAIRPFVVGRKNWLFAATPEGAWASATIYSLIETAKANGLEPYRYLRYLFEHLPEASTAEHYRSLLPHYLTPDQLILPTDPTGAQ